MLQLDGVMAFLGCHYHASHMDRYGFLRNLAHQFMKRQPH